MDADYAPDHAPCTLCTAGTGHLVRGGQIIWDLHELPVEGGRVFEECTTPYAARKRWEAGRHFQPRFTGADPCRGCQAPCGGVVVTCCDAPWCEACYHRHVEAVHGGRHHLPL